MVKLCGCKEDCFVKGEFQSYSPVAMCQYATTDEECSEPLCGKDLSLDLIEYTSEKDRRFAEMLYFVEINRFEYIYLSRRLRAALDKMSNDDFENDTVWMNRRYYDVLELSYGKFVKGCFH